MEEGGQVGKEGAAQFSSALRQIGQKVQQRAVAAAAALASEHKISQGVRRHQGWGKGEV